MSDSHSSPSVNPFLRAVTRLALLAKRPYLLRRTRRPVIETVMERPFLVMPEVLNPVVFRTGKLLAEFVAVSPELCEPCPDPARDAGRPALLDMGTGSGICAVFAAAAGFQVVGVDVNEHAVRCARVNALLNGFEQLIDVRQGDLFAPVQRERFDVVLFNPPFFRGSPAPGFDQAWRSTDVLERFATGLPSVLTDHGKALVLVSTDGDPPTADEVLVEAGFTVNALLRRHYGNEIMTIYSATR